MKNTNTINTPKDWQTDSRMVKTAYVQFWSAGQLATAQLPLDEARTLVDEKQAFVINDQAIGLLTNGRKNA